MMEYICSSLLLNMNKSEIDTLIFRALWIHSCSNLKTNRMKIIVTVTTSNCHYTLKDKKTINIAINMDLEENRYQRKIL